jgi:hypothetical protein
MPDKKEKFVAIVSASQPFLELSKFTFLTK